MPDFLEACRLGSIPEAAGVQAVVNGRKIALFRIGDRVYAIDDTCTHEEASLSEGTVYDDEDEPQVECPKHGAIFDIATGAVRSLPAVKSVNSYETRVEGDTVLVATEPKQA
ncbi:MAG TPA: non-heme iron oxygenase ferredoxin subunit [Chloroflexota bacterium]|jgi:3-phenylpropionate/trans-cinnamate dioxygenase ferredoxin subunit|nr:non-heme iron oxygenase ferredoxin subunit [Chloroflexota bacterium]